MKCGLSKPGETARDISPCVLSSNVLRPPYLGIFQNEKFEESVNRAAKEGKDMDHTLSVVEKAGNMTIPEEDVLRQQVAEMQEAEEKEEATDKAIENKIKVSFFLP